MNSANAVRTMGTKRPRISPPAALASLHQWVDWAYELKPSKAEPTKVPKQLNGHNASSTDPKTWSPFATAHEAYLRNPSFAGVGFVLTPPWVGIDLDDCIEDSGSLKPWALEILARFAGTYAEISPSGSGIKIWIQGQLERAVDVPYEDGNVEIYSQGRYFTVTGQAWEGAPAHIENCQESLDWLLAKLAPAAAERPHGAPIRVEGKIPQGERYPALLRMAGAMAHQGMSVEIIEDAVQKENVKSCDPPREQKDIHRMVESIVEKEHQKNGAASDSQHRKTAEPSRIDIDQIPSIRSFDSAGIGFAVEGLIARNSVNMLSGESGHGKSTLALAMADAIAKGRDFAGRQCSQRPVLILDRENGIDAMQERFKRLGIEDETGLTAWGGWLEQEAPAPGSTVVLDWVQKTEPKPVVIVDTLVAFLECDENNASEVRQFMGQLRQLANLGATVIALHHTGKAETSHEYRGSSDFKGSIDVGIHIRNFGDGELGKMRLKAFKNRFALDRDVILNYSNGRFVSDDRPNSAVRTVTEQLAELLRKNPGVKKTEFENLAHGLQLGRNRARVFLDDGVREGEIRVTSGAQNAKFYYLVESCGGALPW